MQTANIKKIATVLCLGNIILGLIFFATSLKIETFLFTSVGCFAFAAMLLPVALKQHYDVLSTWSVAILSVFIGLFLRGFYIGFEYPNYDLINHLWIRNESYENFLYPSLLLLAGLIICAFGFMASSPKKSLHRFSYSLVSNRLYIFSFFALILSVVSTVTYINLTGGFDVSNLSGKRTIIRSLDLGTEHRTYNFLRTFSEIAIIAHLLVVVDLSKSNYRKRLKLIFAIFLLATALFLPFYSSSRTTVLVFIIMSLAVAYYCNRKVKWSRIVVITLAALFVFQMMFVLRSAPHRSGSVTQLILDKDRSVSAIDSIVLNRNLIELAKTAHIINAVPETLDYKYGQTIAVWAIAWIPRSIWPSKPLISSGPIIGNTLYNTRVSGVPPSLTADLYWNFSLIGVLVGSYFIGNIFGWIDGRLKPSPTVTSSSIDPGRSVIYFYGSFIFGHSAFGYGIGIAIFNAVVSTVLALLVVSIVCVKQPMRQ